MMYCEGCRKELDTASHTEETPAWHDTHKGPFCFDCYPEYDLMRRVKGWCSSGGT